MARDSVHHHAALRTAAHRTNRRRPPMTSISTPISALNDAEHLGPYGDHRQKQADRRQRQRLFGKCAYHIASPLFLEQKGNIVLAMFMVKGEVVTGADLREPIPIPGRINQNDRFIGCSGRAM